MCMERGIPQTCYPLWSLVSLPYNNCTNPYQDHPYRAPGGTMCCSREPSPIPRTAKDIFDNISIFS
jgi:hypothetical protein